MVEIAVASGGSGDGGGCSNKKNKTRAHHLNLRSTSRVNMVRWDAMYLFYDPRCAWLPKLMDS